MKVDIAYYKVSSMNIPSLYFIDYQLRLSTLKIEFSL